jgi:hypothetical protein
MKTVAMRKAAKAKANGNGKKKKKTKDKSEVFKEAYGGVKSGLRAGS